MIGDRDSWIYCLPIPGHFSSFSDGRRHSGILILDRARFSVMPKGVEHCGVNERSWAAFLAERTLET
jgi:hypothetical protein